jgi:hypothetical protein
MGNFMLFTGHPVVLRVPSRRMQSAHLQHESEKKMEEKQYECFADRSRRMELTHNCVKWTALVLRSEINRKLVCTVTY